MPVLVLLLVLKKKKKLKKKQKPKNRKMIFVNQQNFNTNLIRELPTYIVSDLQRVA